ncbi:uncharacterized protein LOC134805205 [Cydia splendana]|uniref:uncharacterized protein LOC134805205 n=1 Tax=Cydia splendana TaxID=1100963 RepID=UPI00300C99C4
MPGTVDTNDACMGTHRSFLKPKEREVSSPLPNVSPVLPGDVIIPPPPLFDTNVSDSIILSENEFESSLPPITVVPDSIVLPETHVAETTMQSTDSTNSPESEIPPPVNYNAHPVLASQPILINPPSRVDIISEVPSQQVFRTPKFSSVSSDEYYKELHVSPGKEPDPPELLHVQYKTLPTVSHIPNSPCNLHPDETYSDDVPTHIPTHYSLRDMRARSLSPKMVHSSTYPPINPYPSLTTVAGTYNPYTCTHQMCFSNPNRLSSHEPQVSPSFVSNLGNDINANVTQPVPIILNEVPKSVQSERRVRFGEVTTAPEPDTLSNSSENLRAGSSSPGPDPKPAWSSKIKAFAIGEVITTVRHFIHLTASFDCVRRQPKSPTHLIKHCHLHSSPRTYPIYVTYSTDAV